MEYVIRYCKESDLDKLVDLCGQHAAYEQASYDLANKKSSLQAAIFQTPVKLYCLVVTYNNSLVGYCSYTFDYSTWDAQEYLHMDCLYLEEDHRGKGLGKALMDELRQIGVKNNCVNMQWQTPVFNQQAFEFYKKMGATAIEKIRFSSTLNTLPLFVA